MRINSQISIAMRKIPENLNAGPADRISGIFLCALTADYDNTVNTLLPNEKAFKFRSEI